MPPTINRNTQRITIPQADLSFVGGVLYELDVDALRLDLKDSEDSEEGMAFPATHQHNTEVVLSGVTYARTVEIINGYTIEFEDTASPYTVRCVGANHNLADVFVPGTSGVSLIIGNSAGLVVSDGGGGGGGLTQQQVRDAMQLAPAPGSPAALSIDLLLRELWRLQGLDAARPLVVDVPGGTVEAGAEIELEHSTAGNVTTVTRQP